MVHVPGVAPHWAPRDKPQEVCALLLDFFKQEFPQNKL